MCRLIDVRYATCWRTGAGKTPCKGWGIGGDLRISLRGPQQQLDHDDAASLHASVSTFETEDVYLKADTHCLSFVRLDDIVFWYFFLLLQET